MNQHDIFDILGPVMIGPSSSHTAGAVRLGNTGAAIFGLPIRQVDFFLHGSFAKTYKGHGTDRALVAGLLGMDTDDERIPQALLIAKEQGLEFSFSEADLGLVHPNTVKMVIQGEASTAHIIGSSLGGGKIEIIRINDTDVSLRGDYPTLVMQYPDRQGMISHISAVISSAGINIAAMKVTRDRQMATMVLELDAKIHPRTFEIFKSDPVFIHIADIGAVEEEDAF